MGAGAMYIAVTGLRSHQEKMDVLAHNIANVNTIGFKSSRVIFSDLLNKTLKGATRPTGTIGGSNPMQIGMGVKVAAIDTIMEQGAPMVTGREMDFMIVGNGFFAVKNGDRILYTRNGSFYLDAEGNVVDSHGYYLLGYTRLTDENTIDTNSVPDKITIHLGQKIEAKVTTQVDFKSNLDSSSNAYGTAELVSPGTTGLTIAAGNAEPIAIFKGNPITATGAGSIVINGGGTNVTISYNTAGLTPQEAAEAIANAINETTFGFPAGSPLPPYITSITPTDTPTNLIAYANDDGSITIMHLYGNNSFTVQELVNPALSGLPATSTTVDPPEPSADLAGNHNITVLDAKPATFTGGVVGAGLAPQDDQITIQFLDPNNPAVPLAQFSVDLNTVSGFSPTNSSYQNAQIIAEAINNAPGNVYNGQQFVEAIANPNGTITIKHLFPGASNNFDISVQDSPTHPAPNGVSNCGFTFALPGSGDKGTGNDDAKAIDEYQSNNGNLSYKRTAVAKTNAGTSSSLDILENLILGRSPLFPLIPGVTLTADDLDEGIGLIKTHDAYRHSTGILVYDSQGNAHNLVTTFIHKSTNVWEWEVSLPDEPHIQISQNKGRIEFTNNGLVSAVYYGTGASATTNPTPVKISPPGADTMEVYLNFTGSGNLLNGVTQFAGPTTTAAEHQDGYAAGVLQAFNVDTDGVFQGIYSNGITKPIAQIVLAAFKNPMGLEKEGESLFRESANSGSAVFHTPRTAGLGDLTSGSLEQSNVDLSQEFTELITTQRGFQANTRVITTEDQILQEVVNLKR